MKSIGTKCGSFSRFVAVTIGKNLGRELQKGAKLDMCAASVMKVSENMTAELPRPRVTMKAFQRPTARVQKRNGYPSLLAHGHIRVTTIAEATTTWSRCRKTQLRVSVVPQSGGARVRNVAHRFANVSALVLHVVLPSSDAYSCFVGGNWRNREMCHVSCAALTYWGRWSCTCRSLSGRRIKGVSHKITRLSYEWP